LLLYYREHGFSLKPFSEDDLLAILESALKDKQKGFGQISIKSIRMFFGILSVWRWRCPQCLE